MTDAEKHSASGSVQCWTDAGAAEMEQTSRGSGRKSHSVSQTGSWRRGMSAQVGVTSPRTKSTSGNKSHGIGTASHSVRLYWGFRPGLVLGLVLICSTALLIGSGLVLV